ncbi:MAG TPA: hypothetical protein VNR41_10925 [Xanthobacteraceae bacterium]|jgi:hypothetical protein|nr:hypothetical protein [Xanthobacteraceae bacterium]
MRFRLLLATAGISLLAIATPALAQGFSFAPPGGGGGGPAVDCQGTVNGLMGERDKAGKALQAANKKKSGPKVACGLLRNYVGIEAKLLKFLRANKTTCGVPDQFLKQLSDANAQSSQMSTKVCEVAANGGGGGPMRTPSSGLSEALGVNTVGGNATGEKPSAVFDTLHGNVLSQ